MLQPFTVRFKDKQDPAHNHKFGALEYSVGVVSLTYLLNSSTALRHIDSDDKNEAALSSLFCD